MVNAVTPLYFGKVGRNMMLSQPPRVLNSPQQTEEGVQGMADVNSGTREAVALDLLEKIARCEGKVFAAPHEMPNEGYTAANRAWILDTYAECLVTVTGGHPLRR
jgi:hypothetical protein